MHDSWIPPVPRVFRQMLGWIGCKAIGLTGIVLFPATWLVTLLVRRHPPRDE